ncbi:MAG TPA: hypothetical protein VL096_05785 [Pirellulaceae bacterium]|nr:hypothetical protein [Pirellulaceae bacterium]
MAKTSTKKTPGKASAKKNPPKTPPKGLDRLKSNANRGVGVIATMVSLLRSASASKPLSKADLSAKLEAKFPDRIR